MTGLPWIADFRDIMVEEDYPADKRIRHSFTQIERETVLNAERVVVTTPATKNLYMSRFRRQPEAKWHCIRNGYDEENFKEASQLTRQVDHERLHLLHSGLLYPTERDPTCFYQALQRLKLRGVIDASKVRITLRSTGHDKHHWQLLQQFGISDIVSLEPGIGYVEALAEMIGADGLLLFQASNCNNQVPAKLYEYLRAGRPILALTDGLGDTAKTLRECGMNSIVPIDDAGQIEVGIDRFLNQVRDGSATCGSAEAVQQYSRRTQAAELAILLDSVCDIS